MVYRSSDTLIQHPSNAIGWRDAYVSNGRQIDSLAHARVFVYVRVCSHYQSIHRRPELFPVLQGSLASPNTIVQARAALTIRHVMTELSSKVLFTNRVEFQTVQRTMPSIDIEYDALEREHLFESDTMMDM